MRKCALLSILILFIMPGLVSADNLDWLLVCSPSREGFDYYIELNKLKNGTLPRSEIVAAIHRDLPSQFIGRNSECIYDAILFFASDSIVTQLKKRQAQPNRADEPGYVEDLIRLLESRSKKYGNHAVFVKEISAYRHPVAVEHFLDLHLGDMSVSSQLAVILDVIQERKLPGIYHYSISVFLERIYVAAPQEYDKFLLSLSKAPYEFTCFKKIVAHNNF